MNAAESPKTIARAILEAAKNNGFKVRTRGCILTITRTFTPGDIDGFRECDMTYGWVLGLVPRTSPGSEWGTDGGSVGGYSAIQSGVFTMNKSGCSKRVLAAIERIQA